ncbi:tetratricopeptide repeat protein [Kineosporia sp. NBRC 101731]|uniref:tetratricopeptide repeat protein n=1 Tax=Kineosporia sp. NBRC 101731 TaxID=3032199 RepID=UPI0024A33332|nr:tetratricopeptide repeat protein [Kineosporia sp. NBRC 101731]GLY28967.1 hypothetical protein Kisp02_23320 [Kineosporia sp. NBRC 101731]
MFGRKRRTGPRQAAVSESESEFAEFLALGRACLEAGEPWEAQQWFIAASDTTDPALLFGLGHSFAEIGATTSAIGVYERAARAGHVDAMNNLGVLLKQADRWEEAETWLRAAASTGDRDALNNLGNLLRVLGRTGEAIDSYLGSARAGHVEAMLSLGQILLHRGDVSTAKDWFQRAARAGHAAGELMLEVAARSEPGSAPPARAEPSGHQPPITLPADDLPAAADALRRRAQATGDPALLDAAIELAAQAASESAADSPERALSTATLCVSLRTRAARTGQKDDLTAAIAAGRYSVAAADACGRHGPRSRTALATALLDAHQAGEQGCLGEAVGLNRDIVATLDLDDIEYPSALTNLSNALLLLGAADQDQDVLGEAVVTGREALRLRPGPSADRARAAMSLSQALLQLGLLTRSLSWVREAGQYAHQALADLPEHDPSRPAFEHFTSLLDTARDTDGEA